MHKSKEESILTHTTRRILFASAIATLVSMGIPASQALAATTTTRPTNTASENQHNQQVLKRKTQIDQLLSDMQRQRAQGLLGALNRIASPATGKAAIASEQTKLASLGVQHLSISQAQAIINRSNGSSNSLTPARAASLATIRPEVSTPPSTSDVQWYSASYTWYYNGSNYDVQELYAQGLNGNSDLSSGANGVVMYTNAQLRVMGLETLAVEAADFAASFVPVVKYVPSALLPGFSNFSGVVNDSENVTYRSLETMCYAYVRPTGSPTYYQEMTFTSNWEDIADTQVLAGYNYGSPYTKSTNQTESIAAPYFANANSEVKAYVDGPYAPHVSWVSAFQFYNWNDTAQVTSYVDTNPLPGTVY